MGSLKVAINGFGRIGRLVFRAGLENPDFEFCGINDLVPPENIAYLLKYDSTHGRFRGTVEARPDGIVVNDRFIPCVSVRNPEELPWEKLGVEYVVEATGLFTDYDGASKHLKAGAKRVVISAPTKDKDPEKVPTLLVGVNHDAYDPTRHTVVSNASCTTNCLAPIAKVIQDNFGFAEGLMTTVHAMTATQPTVDAPAKKTCEADAVPLRISFPPQRERQKRSPSFYPNSKANSRGWHSASPPPMCQPWILPSAPRKPPATGRFVRR